MEQWLCNF